MWGSGFMRILPGPQKWGKNMALTPKNSPKGYPFTCTLGVQVKSGDEVCGFKLM